MASKNSKQYLKSNLFLSQPGFASCCRWQHGAWSACSLSSFLWLGLLSSPHPHLDSLGILQTGVKERKSNSSQGRPDFTDNTGTWSGGSHGMALIPLSNRALSGPSEMSSLKSLTAILLTCVILFFPFFSYLGVKSLRSSQMVVHATQIYFPVGVWSTPPA